MSFGQKRSFIHLECEKSTADFSQFNYYQQQIARDHLGYSKAKDYFSSPSCTTRVVGSLRRKDPWTKKPKLLAGILASPSPVQFHICMSAHVSVQDLQQDDSNICNAFSSSMKFMYCNTQHNVCCNHMSHRTTA